MKAATKKRAEHRIKIIKGQLEALQKQIESDAYCIDILVQSLAAQKSLASLNQLVLQHHIETHITDMFTSGDPKQIERATDELAQLYELGAVRGR